MALTVTAEESLEPIRAVSPSGFSQWCLMLGEPTSSRSGECMQPLSLVRTAQYLLFLRLWPLLCIVCFLCNQHLELSLEDQNAIQSLVEKEEKGRSLKRLLPQLRHLCLAQVRQSVFLQSPRPRSMALSDWPGRFSSSRNSSFCRWR